MKNRTVYIIFFFISLTAAGCGSRPADNPLARTNDMGGWSVDIVAPGCVWYNYTGYYAPTDANQTINVLEIDLSRREYSLAVVHSEEADSLSAFSVREKAFAGVNGSYFEPDVSFVKVGGRVWREVTLAADHVRWWKHEGAFFHDAATGRAAIACGDNASYLASDYPTVLSGAPVLIDDYRPVGEDFAAVPDSVDIRSLDYEDYRRHQGARHPRVAIALTDDNRALLVTVDGRWWTSSGMSAGELTRMLVRHFSPRYALNLDGGGSTTMRISGRGVNDTNVVNFPVDNRRYDHYGQRAVNNVILVKKND